MAAYRFSAQVIKRSAGRSAVAAAAYRAGDKITDERTGLDHDYQSKSGVVHSEILKPHDAPEWMGNRANLWNAVEKVERRKDAQLAREILLNLPHELDEDQRRDLTREFVQEQFVSRGMVADLNIHAPNRAGDDRNHHAHVMLTMRTLTADSFGKKDRDWNQTDLLETWRERWATHQNRFLERAGLEVQVDHRSLADQGIDREPEPKLGPVATQMERDGRRSNAGDDLRRTRAENAARDAAYAQAQVIDLQIERERRHSQGRAKDTDNDAAHALDQELEYSRKAYALREQISQVHKRLADQGVFSRMWFGLTGRNARDRQTVEGLQAQLTAIQKEHSEVLRMDEARATAQSIANDAKERVPDRGSSHPSPVPANSNRPAHSQKEKSCFEPDSDESAEDLDRMIDRLGQGRGSAGKDRGPDFDI